MTYFTFSAVDRYERAGRPQCAVGSRSSGLHRRALLVFALSAPFGLMAANAGASKGAAAVSRCDEFARSGVDDGADAATASMTEILKFRQQRCLELD